MIRKVAERTWNAVKDRVIWLPSFHASRRIKLRHKPTGSKCSLWAPLQRSVLRHQKRILNAICYAIGRPQLLHSAYANRKYGVPYWPEVFAKYSWLCNSFMTLEIRTSTLVCCTFPLIHVLSCTYSLSPSNSSRFWTARIRVCSMPLINTQTSGLLLECSIWTVRIKSPLGLWITGEYLRLRRRERLSVASVQMSISWKPGRHAFLVPTGQPP